MTAPWNETPDMLDKHSESYDPDALLDQLESQRKHDQESGVSPGVVSPLLRLTLDFCGCPFCKTAQAALEDAWDAHKGRGR